MGFQLETNTPSCPPPPGAGRCQALPPTQTLISSLSPSPHAPACSRHIQGHSGICVCGACGASRHLWLSAASVSMLGLLSRGGPSCLSLLGLSPSLGEGGLGGLAYHSLPHGVFQAAKLPGRDPASAWRTELSAYPGHLQEALAWTLGQPDVQPLPPLTPKYEGSNANP